MTSTTDRIAELLADHRYRERLLDCSCGGWKAAPLSSNVKWGKQHEAHVASLLAVLVADAQTDAWDEGRDHGRDNSRDGYCLCTSLEWAETDQCVNPYRLDAGDEFQDPKDRENGEEHAGNNEVVSSHTPHNTPEGDENSG